MTAQITPMHPCAVRSLIDRAESEKAFQQRLLDLAKACGWLVYHPFDSRKSGAGFPDLTMCRGEKLIMAELKRENGRLSHAQAGWINRLRQTGTPVYIWRPSDWNTIVDVLMPERQRKGRSA